VNAAPEGAEAAGARDSEPATATAAAATGLGSDAAAAALAADPEIQLLVPASDTADPEFSIVIPALNEELTIADFIAWCHEGMSKAGIRGEILIVDSSKDRTAEIAVARGARVLKTPKRGLGRAYLDALPFIRGKYVLMGDCDCTYDFRELAPFVEKFRGGAEFIMGSRFRGYIEPGSMPPLHRYLGTPVTTWILNVIFASRFSDIHCGMRGITREALARMDLRSQSWEYASEMVLKSVHMRLPTAEVPIRFLKDREGRLSHHKRSGWFSPWHAAWINLRAMFVYGANFFLFKPGLLLLALGLLLTLPLSLGTITIGPITFSLYWMLLGVSLSLLGLQCVYMGILSQVFFDYSGAATRRWFGRFPYTRTVGIAAALFASGVAAAGLLTVNYVRQDFHLRESSPLNHLGVMGLLLMIVGFMTFTFTLLLHSTAVAVRRR
jgi:glycosyltransferase involved in cell wall biosynthesis